jgi:large subunit ribosomal protein L10
MKTRAEKQAIVESLASKLKGSLSSVFVHFEKMNVADEYDMRRTLTRDGVKYFVTRKTLMKRAGDTAGVTGTLPPLVGEVAVVSAETTDVTLAPRSIHEFVSKFKDKITIIGGIVDGAYVSGEEMRAIATIPPVQTLRGMFVNVINSPIQGFVTALSKIAEKKA